MTEQTLSEQEMNCFTKIVNFVSCLNDVYGKSNYDVALYNRLLQKTKMSFRKSIRKHVQTFGTFCQRNNDALVKKDFTLIVSERVEFSTKVSINMKKVLASADDDNRNVIWQHLLTISLCIDPSAKIRDVLKQSLENDRSKEGELLNNFFTKIDNSIDKEKVNSDPMSAATSMLNSGVVTELLGSLTSGVQKGDLNLNKLMGSIQGMMGALTSNMGNGGGGDNPMGGIMNMMSGLMSGMGGVANANNNSAMTSSTVGSISTPISTPIVVTNEDHKALEAPTVVPSLETKPTTSANHPD